MDTIVLIVEIIAVVAVLGIALHVGNRRLVAHYEQRPHLNFRRQLIQIGATLVAVLLLIIFLPIGDEMRGQLLRLYGLIFSATIALSSTTLVGNVMAGLMLKTIGNLKLGTYVTVGDYFGRITEMDLLHTEIQTEERDLTTLPNMYLITNPVRVMRSSGTLLSVHLSLGYDVSRHRVEELLIGAATDSGLEKPYVQITELGDFSVTYQVSALLTDVSHIIGKRRELRARTMDALHGAGIEIVSPTFMNTRVYESDTQFIAKKGPKAIVDTEDKHSPDAIAFDKAERAKSVEDLRAKLHEAEQRLRVCVDTIATPPNEQAATAAADEKVVLEEKIERLSSLILKKESRISNDN